MKLITRNAGDFHWFEIEHETEAIAAGQSGKTAFGVYFVEERRRGGTGRFFVLQNTRGVQVAFCRIPPLEGRELTLCWSDRKYLQAVVVARCNGDPFPTHKEEIQALSRALGTPIDETCYPNPNKVEPLRSVPAIDDGHELVPDKSSDLPSGL